MGERLIAGTSLAVVIEKGLTLMDKHLIGPQERVLPTDRLLTGGLTKEMVGGDTTSHLPWYKDCEGKPKTKGQALKICARSHQ